MRVGAASAGCAAWQRRSSTASPCVLSVAEAIIAKAKGLALLHAHFLSQSHCSHLDLLRSKCV